MTENKSLVTGLAGLKSRKERFEKEQEERNRPKANWFKINSGETLTVRFLQEMDESSPNYNPAFGKFLGAIEHQAHGPKGYLSRALDTTETDPEGRDFAEEMYKKTKESGWRKKENFYINVAVVRDGKPTVEILSRNMHSDFVDDLVELYEDNDETITDRSYTITRRGQGAKTTWKIKEAKEDINIDGLQPWNLEEYAVRKVAYDDQKEFYMRNYQADEPEEDDSETSGASNGGSQASEDLDW